MLCACAIGRFAITLVDFLPEVKSVTGSDRVRMRNRYILYYNQSSSTSTWLPTGWKGVCLPNRKLCNSPLVGSFHWKLAKGSDVIFPCICLSGSAQCWLGYSLRRPHLPLSLVICPFYFHNYIYNLLFSDMLCSTPRMVFLSQMNEMCDIFIMCFVLFLFANVFWVEFQRYRGGGGGGGGLFGCNQD